MPKNLGQQFVEFFNTFEAKDSNQLNKDLDELFAPNVKKIVNSRLFCANRDELVKQTADALTTYGHVSVVMLDAIEDVKARRVAVQFEATWSKDNVTDVSIVILKLNDQGLIEEINEASGEKSCYQWQQENTNSN